MTQPMIAVKELTKSYGEVHAVRSISFEIPRGQIVGFLGPNGAGKTTTMKVLTGYIAPTSGSFMVDGLDGYEQGLQVRNRVGYLPEHNPLYPELVVYDFLSYVASLRRIPKKKIQSRIREVGSRCGIQEFVGRPIGTLSKGQRQRVGLAQAMIHDPPLLILDEPTSGLDPNQIVEIRNLVRELGQDHTVILSTHNLPEVMQTCTRLLIIHQGKIVADGTQEELQRDATDNPTVILEVEGGADDTGSMTEQLEKLNGIRSVKGGVQEKGIRFIIETADGSDLRTDIFGLAATAGWSVRELRRDVPDLEHIFHRLTQQ